MKNHEKLSNFLITITINCKFIKNQFISLNCNLLKNVFLYRYVHFLLYKNKLIREFFQKNSQSRHNITTKRSIYVISASLESAWIVLQLKILMSNLYVVDDCNANRTATVRVRRFWWLIEWNIIVFLFENLNFQLIRRIETHESWNFHWLWFFSIDHSRETNLQNILL